MESYFNTHGDVLEDLHHQKGTLMALLMSFKQSLQAVERLLQECVDVSGIAVPTLALVDRALKNPDSILGQPDLRSMMRVSNMSLVMPQNARVDYL